MYSLHVGLVTESALAQNYSVSRYGSPSLKILIAQLRLLNVGCTSVLRAFQVLFSVLTVLKGVLAGRRVLIKQRHIRVGKQLVNVPSFMVRTDAEKHIDFSHTSPYGPTLEQQKAEATYRNLIQVMIFI